MALATVNYDVLDANIAYSNGDTNALNFNTSGNTITFTSPSAMLVGSGGGAGHNAATVTIIYTITSDKALTGIDLNFGGQATNLGMVTFNELVENWSQSGGSGSVLASTSGHYDGSGFTGGSDNPFANSTTLNFGAPVFSYKVKKTFSLLDLDNDPGNSMASITSVEQTAVPEPASMTALAAGALGLLARRRRRS